MDKKIAGLLGAVAALGTMGPANAVPAAASADLLRADSFAALLEPVPNAADVLRTLDEQSRQTTEGNVQLVQYYRHHHHHHHHHGYFRRAPRIVVVPRWRRHYHHHHHHHHHHFYRRY